MMLEVKLFARARDLAGTGAARLELRDGATVGELRAALSEQFPKMRPLVPALLVAVGREYADDMRRLAPDVDVACFPPVSGG